MQATTPYKKNEPTKQRFLTENDKESLAQIASDDLSYLGPMIQISGVCNLKCTMCGGAQDIVPGKFMDIKLFETICKKLKSDQVSGMIIAGAYGEPFLHPKIFDILHMAKSYGFNVVLSTHGNNLDEEKINKLVALRLHHIQFSYCGFDAETYERIYKGGKFEKATKNMRYLKQQLKKQWRMSFFSRKPKTGFLVNGVCDRDDASIVERTRAFLKTLGVALSEMRIVLPHNFASQAVSFEQMQEFGQQKSFKQLTGDHKHLSICKVLTKAPGILWDGRISACGCLDYKGILELGNIQFMTMKEARNSTRFKEIAAAFENGDVSKISLCDSCDVPYGDSDARVM